MCVCLGTAQHEFDYGEEALRTCISRSNFKWFGSNVIDNRTNQLLDGITDSQVINLTPDDGLKLGLFGVCTQATPHLSNPGPYIDFKNVEETAERVSYQYLKVEQKCHVIVALTHLHTHQDKALASRVSPHVNVIVGGHDHDPISLLQDGTLVFKCGQNGYWVGVVDLNVDYEVDEEDDNTVIDSTVRVFSSWHMHSTCHAESDPHIEDMVCRYQRIADKEMLANTQAVKNGGDDDEDLPISLEDTIVTLGDNYALVTLTAEVRRRETSSGNLIADAMLHYYTTTSSSSNNTLAMINGGFIRGDKTYPPGSNLTLRDILTELPFPKNICLLQINGDHLQNAMEQQLAPLPMPTASFPHVSHNVTLVYDVTKPPMHRIIKFCINGKPIDPCQKYCIAVTEFLASGGDGCSSWCYGVAKRNDVDDDDAGCPPPRHVSGVLIDYLRGLSNVCCPQVEQRVTCV